MGVLCPKGKEGERDGGRGAGGSGWGMRCEYGRNAWGGCGDLNGERLQAWTDGQEQEELVVCNPSDALLAAGLREMVKIPMESRWERENGGKAASCSRAATTPWFPWDGWVQGGVGRATAKLSCWVLRPNSSIGSWSTSSIGYGQAQPLVYGQTQPLVMAKLNHWLWPNSSIDYGQTHPLVYGQTQPLVMAKLIHWFMAKLNHWFMAKLIHWFMAKLNHWLWPNSAIGLWSSSSIDYGQTQPSVYGQTQPLFYGQTHPLGYGQTQPLVMAKLIHWFMVKFIH